MKTIENDYRKAIHYQPINNYRNVRCLNGSAHIRRTTDINFVTCAKCLDKNTFKRFWNEKIKEKIL